MVGISLNRLFRRQKTHFKPRNRDYFFHIFKLGYIHLNPLRAQIVVNFKDLVKYPYCGHSVLVGKRQNEFQDVEYVFKQFGNKLSEARHNYREFVRKRNELGNRPELVGGGLLRSSGGWGVLKAMSKARIHLIGDERILGESDFVKKVLSGQEEKFNRRYWLRAKGYDIEKVVKRKFSQS